MTSLQWRNITEVRLREALIPDPSGTGMLDIISSGKVATDGSFLYIDAGATDNPREAGADFTVVAVPVTTVLSFTYRERVRKPGVRGF